MGQNFEKLTVSEDFDDSNNRNRFYVYCFYNEDWDEIFYIGKGCGDRYKTLRGRSEQIIKIFSKHPCVSKILINNLSEQTALQIEELLKNEYIHRGAPIIDYERKTVLQNQRRGIERAKKEGKYKGSKKKSLPQDFQEKYTLYQQRGCTKTQLAQYIGVSRPTLDRMIKEFKDSELILSQTKDVML